MKPLWDNLNTRNEILNIANTNCQIDFTKNADNTLTLQLKNKDQTDILNIKNELENQNFNKVVLFWDFEKYEYGIKINDKIYRAKLENTIKDKNTF